MPPSPDPAAPGRGSGTWIPLLVLLAIVLFAVQRGLLSWDTTRSVGRWVAGHPLGDALRDVPLGAPEVLAALAVGVMLLVSWRLPLRLAVVVATWGAATYAQGLLSDGSVEATISQLASQPGVDVFEAPPRGFLDAVFVLGASIVLIPLLGLVFLVLVWAWSAFLREIVTPLGSRRVLPEWVLTLSFLGVLSFAAYAGNAAWLPWGSWVTGVIARAYLIVTG